VDTEGDEDEEEEEEEEEEDVLVSHTDELFLGLKDLT
jgi:hypothetical protein